MLNHVFKNDPLSLSYGLRVTGDILDIRREERFDQLKRTRPKGKSIHQYVFEYEFKMSTQRREFIDQVVEALKELDMFDEDTEAFIGEIVGIQDQFLDVGHEKRFADERKRRRAQDEIAETNTLAPDGEGLDTTTQARLAELVSGSE